MAIDPCIQESPRWTSTLPLLEFQAALHAWMPDCTPAGLLKTFCCKAGAGIATFTSPISFCPFASDAAPTVASAKAIELDVPSSTALIDLHCWWANSPVYGTLLQSGPALGNVP